MIKNQGRTMIQSSEEKFHRPVSDRENWLAEQIVGIAISIHRILGPGLLESVYQKCFCYELTKRNIPFVKQKCVELIYDGFVVDEGLKIDILVDELIIIELKAQELYHPVWEAQLLSYLRLTGKRLGYILNFHVPLMKNGVKRMVL